MGLIPTTDLATVFEALVLELGPWVVIPGVDVVNLVVVDVVPVGTP